MKKLVLIRHGCTYMNEYLSKPGNKWGDPNFTDIFSSDDGAADRLYRDTPLSERGLAQAKSLSGRLLDCDMLEDRAVLEGIELIAVSPLTRALQTLEIGVLPYIRTTGVSRRNRREDDGVRSSSTTKHDRTVPIVALPLAAERLYLVSDLGSGTSTLSSQYPYVDFDTEFCSADDGDEWWYTVSDRGDGGAGGYEEWRPNEDGQTYACPGEPDATFGKRMEALYDWIDGREESVVCVICHWGVLEWLTGVEFDNCEMRIVDFKDIKREGSSSN